ncbi:apelin receptor early endogenous ligand [Pseudoliparis swirei]|uniref:apelin receptor early endogenous ligand n=1 Tax=Pseudoliparis swirei TaxID=2059687 RepID=UPI0024BE4C6E|nr:apelin receptor early endogenous ligand [Pseudoliparis swirei]
MRVFNLLYLALLLVAAVAAVSSARPGKHPHNSSVQNKPSAYSFALFCILRSDHFLPDFLNLRRRYHRHHCPFRRCMPLHSRVPFP